MTAKERSAFKRAQQAVLDAKAVAWEANETPEATERCRELFRCLEALMAMGAPLSIRDWRVIELHPEIAYMLKGLFGYLAVGQLPEPIADCIGAGRAERNPSERRDLEFAAAYMAAAKAGHVNDKSPVKTVADAYGVDRRTAQRWQNEVRPSFDWQDQSAENLSDYMRMAGERYLTAGRSHEAIRNRGK